MYLLIMTRYTVYLALLLIWGCEAPQKGMYTASGVISMEDMGFTLTHEHIMSNFGAPVDSTSYYREELLLAQVIPYLQELRSRGVVTIFDCTTQYFGRRVDLLSKMSEASGINIITNTGIYGAANDRYIPEYAYEQDPDQIAEAWITEFESGIEGSGIKPGFIKLAFDGGTPSEIDKKLFEAGAITHLATGLTMAVHTSSNTEAADMQLQILDEYGVSPGAWVWVHAYGVEDISKLIETARKGAWISLDAVKESNYREYVEKLKVFKENDLLHKVLLSHDGNGFPRGGAIRPFQAIPGQLIPALLEQGFSQDEVDQLMIRNPANAFGIKVRRK